MGWGVCRWLHPILPYFRCRKLSGYTGFYPWMWKNGGNDIGEEKEKQFHNENGSERCLDYDGSCNYRFVGSCSIPDYQDGMAQSA